MSTSLIPLFFGLDKSDLHLPGLVTSAPCPQADGLSPCTPGEPLAQLHHRYKVYEGDNSQNCNVFFQDHSAGGFASMDRMRIHGQLCDIKLKSGMTVVAAHRVVLAAVSPYFHAMFNGKFYRL